MIERDMNESAGGVVELARLLEKRGGPDYWRSLEELAEDPAVREAIASEFPADVDVWEDGVSRRRFLKLMGASLALAGLGSCTRPPDEEIVPYVEQPEYVIPGKALFFATALLRGGHARGVLVESHLGRPTKIEGNELHPSSLGATDAITQAEILGLYDPDRSQVLMNGRRISTWAAFLAAGRAAMTQASQESGRGLHLLTGAITSPTEAAAIMSWLQRFPDAVWHRWDPAVSDAAKAGAQLAFGRVVDPVFHFERADVVLALDGDVLAEGAGAVACARGFGERRDPSAPGGKSRVYAVESTPTLLGAVADHRWILDQDLVPDFAAAVARAAGVKGVDGGDGLDDAMRARAAAVAEDLAAHRGASLVTAVGSPSPLVHALAHALNVALGNVGTTIDFIEPPEVTPVSHRESLQALCTDIDAGRVRTLIISGTNPAYSAPGDCDFVAKLAQVPLRIHHGTERNETAALADWHVPAAHDLESWGDARGHDGTVTIRQPLIAPLYHGRTLLELLGALLGDDEPSAHALVRANWRGFRSGDDDRAFERWWRRCLHDGVVPDTAFAPVEVALRGPLAVAPAPRAGLTLDCRLHPTVADGRFANNGWLQETPQPFTKLTWDNAALVAPATAARLGLANGDVVELKWRGGLTEAPVWVLPGQAPRTVTVHLGLGRRVVGAVGEEVGFDAYPVWRAGRSGDRLELRKTGATRPLATTQQHHTMDGRPLIREATLAAYRADADVLHASEHHAGGDHSIYPSRRDESGHAWGLSIDLNRCIGCNACLTACQSENNIPVVGKEQVAIGREMHWIRIDRYFTGPLDHPGIRFQPVTCMHCENAPCEPVCPVGATVHSTEGLNEMVYNRCVGTRYCSNNCPYKVRRFNFLEYHDREHAVLDLMRNPDVTVRSRGVMEKCTYCVQRINAARIEAKKESRPIRDGEIVTACQGACPTRAIVFGDVNDPASRVSKAKASSLDYGLYAAELNTRPRTTYRGILTNPNGKLGERDQ